MVMQAVLSGCETATPAPSEGDVRLMTLNGTTAGTAACDEVHFGGVGMFFQGRWGRICNGRLGSDHDEFTLDAQVICRQLGFPFGTVMNEEDTSTMNELEKTRMSSPGHPRYYPVRQDCL